MNNFLERLHKHNDGISCFVAGVCLESGLVELAHHNYGAALFNFVIAGINLYFYKRQ